MENRKFVLGKRKGGLSTRVFLALLFTVIFFVAAFAGTKALAAKLISGCQSITEPGDYLLAADFTITNPISMISGCLEARNVANVNIDCQQHTINGSRGILLSNVQNSSVKNCHLKGNYNLLTVQNSIGIKISSNLLEPSDSSNTQSTTLLIQDSGTVNVEHNTLIAELSLLRTINSTVLENVMMSPIAGTAQPGTAILPAMIFMLGGNHNVIRGNHIDGKAIVIPNDYPTSEGFGGADDAIVLVSLSDSQISGNIMKNFWDLGIEGLGALTNVTLSENIIEGASMGAIGGWWKEIGNKTDYGFSMSNCTIENNVASKVGSLFVFSPPVPNGFDLVSFNNDANAQAVFPGNHFITNSMAGAIEECSIANGKGQKAGGICQLVFCNAGFSQNGNSCVANAADPVADKITSFYKQILGRDPDQAGLDYWVKNVKSGAITTEGIAANFRIVASVANLYKEVLGREPDQEGLDYWVGQISRGEHSLAEVRKNFIWCKNLPPTDSNHCS